MPECVDRCATCGKRIVERGDIGLTAWVHDRGEYAVPRYQRACGWAAPVVNPPGETSGV